MDTNQKNQDHYHSDDAVNQNKEVGNKEGLDSSVNTNFNGHSDGKQSLTNDEPASKDPNADPEKPTFKSANDERR